MALNYRVVHQQPDLTGLDRSLADLVASCLAKDPADRPIPATLLGALASGTPSGNWLPSGVQTLITGRTVPKTRPLVADSQSAAAHPVLHPSSGDPDGVIVHISWWRWPAGILTTLSVIALALTVAFTLIGIPQRAIASLGALLSVLHGRPVRLTPDGRGGTGKVACLSPEASTFDLLICSKIRNVHTHPYSPPKPAQLGCTVSPAPRPSVIVQTRR